MQVWRCDIGAQKLDILVVRINAFILQKICDMQDLGHLIPGRTTIFGLTHISYQCSEFWEIDVTFFIALSMKSTASN